MTKRVCAYCTFCCPRVSQMVFLNVSGLVFQKGKELENKNIDDILNCSQRLKKNVFLLLNKLNKNDCGKY
uniref:Uncharacterized protein n=1 Tax=Anguilla anguilla TaxID=7936 RepID=A0A0E9P5V8_ANGAN